MKEFSLGGQRAVAWSLRVVSLAAFLGAWEWYGRQPDVLAVAPVSEVAESLVGGLVSGELVTATAATVQTFAVGYVITVILGVTFGLLIGVSRWATNTLEPLVHAAYSTPASLLIPVLGIYTGFGFRGRVVLVVLWSVFEVLINTTGAVRAVPESLVEAGRAFGARRVDFYRKIVLPAAMPQIAVGLRLAVGKAIRGAVTAEILLAVSNLGGVLVNAGATFNIPRLLAGIVLVMLMGLALMRSAEALERRSLRWQKA